MLSSLLRCGLVRGDLSFGRFKKTRSRVPIRIILSNSPDSGVCLNMSEFYQRFFGGRRFAYARTDAGSVAPWITGNVLSELYGAGARPISPLTAVG